MPEHAPTPILLPEKYPVVTVSLDTGKKLRMAGRAIEVDFFALAEAFRSVGVNDDDFEKIDFTVKDLAANTHGEADFNLKGQRYTVDVSPSKKQLLNKRQKKMNKTIVHEARHTYDFLDIAEKKGAKHLNRRLKFEGGIPILGGLAISMVTIHAVQAIFSELDIPTTTPLSFGLVIGSGIVNLYFGTKAVDAVVYQLDPLEKNARQAAKEHTVTAPILSFPALSEHPL